MQGKLSRTEMKNVMAGNGGSYCSHNASWSYYNCGLSAAEAQKIEDIVLIKYPQSYKINCITKLKIVSA